MKFLIKSGELFLENETIKNGSILVENGIIGSINPVLSDTQDIETIDLGALKLMPGFVDIHVHGGNGHDTIDSTYQAINELSKFKIKEGVTSFCPTTVTTSIEKTKIAIDKVRLARDKGVDGAQIIGSFLEGPYISPKWKGAHPEKFIRDINMDEIKDIIRHGQGSIKSFAIAPDKADALDAIEYLTENNIAVSIGHSGATLKEANTAVEKGAKIGIHAYNAMSPLTHREPGMVGAIMLNDNIYAEIICDLVHVCPEAVKILLKCKGADKIILITDCMMAGGLEDGKYNLGELPVKVENHIARTMEGALAGSTLSIISAIKNMHLTVGAPLVGTVKMATANPAKAIGAFDRKGSVAVGKDADLTAIDDNYNIKFVMVGGKRLI